MKSKVVVLKTSPETVTQDYERLLELAEVKRVLDLTRTTILKDNISWHLFMPGANTTPWQLEGTITGLKKSGFADLVAVENNTVVTDPFKGERLNKYSEIYQKYKIPVKYNFRQSDISWIKYEPKGEMLVMKDMYKEGIYLPDFFFGKNIVHLPTMKCHIYTTTTGAMKNAFGGLINTKRHYTHSVIHKTLVDLLRIQKEIHSGVFAVMDGTTAGNGPGPRTLIPVVKNYILASDDQVAIDAVAAKMMGFDPASIHYIYMADKAGLGNGKLDNIEIVGENIVGVNFGFFVGTNAAASVGRALWFSPLKFFQKLFFHTPLVNVFVFASMLYHDFIWYPIFGMKRVRLWLGTEWGKLWLTYK